ncbi:MAG: hypothetical protein ACLTSF_11445 [Acutalibacteraceae bacterium]
MKKQSAVKIILYILYILSGAYTAFGIFKYSYPPTVVREAVAGFLSKLGVDIGVTGSEIIYHFFCLAFAAVSVIAFFFSTQKRSRNKRNVYLGRSRTDIHSAIFIWLSYNKQIYAHL